MLSAFSANGSVLIDTMPPTTPGTPSTSSPTTNHSPTWSWTPSSDAGTGVNHYSVCYDTAAGGCAHTASVTTASFSASLSDGTWYMKVKAVDGLGHESAFSGNGKADIQSAATPPPTPPPPTPAPVPKQPPSTGGSQVTSSPAAPSITSPAPGTNLADEQIRISGKGASGAKLELYDDTALLGTTTVASDGSWEFALKLPDKEYAVRARQKTGGDFSDYSQVVKFTVKRSFTESIANIARQTPKPVARSFPYLLLTLLLVVVAILGWQTQAETRRIGAYTRLLEQQQALAFGKENFMTLGAHYLLTPLTLLNIGLEELSESRQLSPGVLEKLAAHTKFLQTKISKIVSEINSADFLKTVVKRDLKKAKIRAYASPFLIVPLASVLTVIITSNYLFVRVGTIEVSYINFISQALGFIAVGLLMFTFFRHRKLKQNEREAVGRLISEKKALDDARNKFLTDTSTILKTELDAMQRSIKKVPTDIPSVKVLSEGIARLGNILGRLEILSELKSGRAIYEHGSMDVSKAVDNALAEQAQTIQVKGLKVTNTLIAPEMIESKPKYLGFVISTLINNAVKFGDKGSEIKIGLDVSAKVCTLRIVNRGPLIDQHYLALLFEPFARAGLLENFDYEGIGLSLFLDKVIIEYLGGSIAINSSKRGGTEVALTFPKQASEEYIYEPYPAVTSGSYA